MKKQLVSLLLLFVFVLGLGTPAAAYEEDSNRAEWTLETIGKYLDSAPAVEVAPAQKDDLIVGINGAFYFTYTSGSNSGTTGGAMMGAGLTVNSDKTN